MKRAFGTGFAMVTGAALSPVAGALLAVGILVSFWVASLSLSIFANGLAAPSQSTIIGTAIFVAASVTSYAATRRRDALMRRRFEQHLAPAVVRGIFEKPGGRKLIGERRDVTALFTDIEGFCAMTRHADPAALVAILDDYFEGMVTIIV